MRIWKCDMCGDVLEKEEDVFTVGCSTHSDRETHTYDLCRFCATTTEKFIKKEWNPGLYPSLKTIYDYCKSEECDNCVLNPKRNQHDVECMVGLPEDKWAKEYPDLEKERDGK